MKKFLIVYHGDTPECVEGFSESCQRSSDYKGALHLNPGKQLTVTEDELKHIQAAYKHVCAKLRIISEKKEVLVKKDEAKAESASLVSEEAKAEAPAKEEAPAVSDAQGSSKKKKS